MAAQPTSAEHPAGPLLKETCYSLKELLREVEHERRHSVLGLELVDQSEIRAIFKTRPKRKLVKRK